MKKIFSSNLLILLCYCVISIIISSLTCLCLLIDSPFNYYPCVVTAISFAFGGFYLGASLLSMNQQMDVANTSKGAGMAKMMGANFVRFMILVLAIVVNFVFIKFANQEVEIEKWVYALLLITGVPMFVNIALFYLRGKYIE